MGLPSFLPIVSEFQTVPSYCLVTFPLLNLLGLFQQEESEVGLLGGGNGQLWTLGLGLLVTAFAAAYVTRLAKVIYLNELPLFLKLLFLICCYHGHYATNVCILIISI